MYAVDESFLIRPQELSGNYQQIYLLAKQEKLGEKVAGEFSL
jgi:hypothetical protein